MRCGARINATTKPAPCLPSPARLSYVLLVERADLFESRAKAQAAIAAGLVTADDAPVRKPSEPLALDAALEAAPAFAWVSRGGVKLADALDRFGVAVAGRVCLDVGASTGGFTDVLLARGARLVYAIDVGTGQLHPRLRGRPDVRSFEQTDIRAFDQACMPKPPAIVAVDVSFISLKLVLPAALALAARPAHLLALIKPQFEAPRRRSRRASCAIRPSTGRSARTSPTSRPRSDAPTLR